MQHGCLERDEAEALLQDLVDGGHLKCAACCMPQGSLQEGLCQLVVLHGCQPEPPLCQLILHAPALGTTPWHAQRTI